jgi:hypothetical protein
MSIRRLTQLPLTKLVAATVLLFWLCAPASAVVIIIDELGFGYLRNDAGATFFLPASVQPDPGPGGLPAVLTYDMLGPPSLVAGDVLIVNALEGLSDVIRFNPAGTGSPGYPAFLLGQHRRT